MADTRATVIDDDADIAELICELLEAQGLRCVSFTDALPGIGELAASRPDLIVIDLALRAEREQLTGLQVVHAARSGVELRDIPIILLISEPIALDQVWPEVMQRGDVQRLTKPFDLIAFERVVNTALGRRQGGTENARDHGLHAVPDGEGRT